MAQIESLTELFDGLIVSQQMLVAWLVESHGANPAALSALVADFRQSCRQSVGSDIVLQRMQDYAEQIAVRQNGGTGTVPR